MKTPKDYREALAPLTGKWGIVITNMAFREDKQAEMTGTASFEWTELNLLRYTSNIDRGEVPNSVSVIGYDASEEKIEMLYTDDRDVTRIYSMSIADKTWKIWRTGDPFAQRFEGKIAEDGKVITAFWEQKDEQSQTWIRDFDMIFTKIS